MKVRELKTLIYETVNQIISEAMVGGKTSHLKKYRKSRFHPDETDRLKRVQAIQQQPAKGIYNVRTTQEPTHEIAPNIKLFLNTTIEAIPQDQTTTKILRGLPISKHEANLLSKRMLGLPGFPFQQPRKLANMLILLAAENSRDDDH